MSFVPGAAGTPVTIDLNVNDLSTGDSLVGSISTTAVDAGTGTYLSENLDGSGYVWLTEWSDGFAGNSLEVADVQATPDGATTILLLGSSFAGLAILRRRFGRS